MYTNNTIHLRETENTAGLTRSIYPLITQVRNAKVVKSTNTDRLQSLRSKYNIIYVQNLFISPPQHHHLKFKMAVGRHVEILNLQYIAQAIGNEILEKIHKIW